MKIKKLVKEYFSNASLFPLVVFLIIWFATFIALINTIVINDFVKVGLALSALILYFVPFFVAVKFKIKLPGILEVVYYLFIFAALVLGEVFAFYGPFPFWDIILHLLSGFVLAGIGFSLFNIVSKGKQPALLVLLFAFCFSITLGVAWECLEFSFDITVRTDAQKDAHLTNISTITLQRDGGNQPVRLNDIEKSELYLASGEIVTIEEGHLDIGLMDTMKDLFVNTGGAVVFCILGIFYCKDSRKYGFVDKLIPKKI